MAARTHQLRNSMETLEARAVPAFAALSNGVLTIEGTFGNDQIIVRQAGNAIAIDGVPIYAGGYYYSAVNADYVNRLEVIAFPGNDTVSLGENYYRVLRPARVWGGPGFDVVVGGAANDELHGQGDGDALYGLEGNDILVGGDGGDYLNGVWGDDALYGGPGTDGLVGGDGSDFLHAGGGTAASLYEPDYIDGGAGFDYYADDFNLAQPVLMGVDLTDIHQRDMGTCQTLAALAAGVREGIDFGQRIQYQGGNSFLVQLLGGYGTHNVWFNGVWTDNDPAPVNGLPEFWPMMMQRARLQALGINWSVPQDDNVLHAQTGGRYGNPADALLAVTGRPVYTPAMGAVAQNPQGLRDAILQGYLVVAGTNVTASDMFSPDGIVRRHAYAVADVFVHNGVWMVRLYNPWGQNYHMGLSYGYVTLTWNQFIHPNNFSSVFIP
jgi:hypothetical protein